MCCAGSASSQIRDTPTTAPVLSVSAAPMNRTDSLPAPFNTVPHYILLSTFSFFSFLFFFSLYFSFFYCSFLPHIDCFAAWTKQAKFSFELFLYRFILFHFFSHVVPFHPVPSINPFLDIALRFLTALHRTAS